TRRRREKDAPLAKQLHRPTNPQRGAQLDLRQNGAGNPLHQQPPAGSSEIHVTTKKKTIIVTGASQGIGAAVANLFLDRGHNVVGNSRRITQKNELQASTNLALVDGDIGLASTAETIVATALKRFGSVDALVNNAGIFFTKPFTEY